MCMNKKWVQNTAKAGFPVTAEQLIVSVEKYLKDIKRPCALFKNGRPGKTWLKAYLFGGIQPFLRGYHKI